MKVRISDLGPNGLDIREKLTAASMNARMALGRATDIEFLEDASVELHVESRPGGAEVNGTLRARYRQPCSRCDDRIDRSLEIPIKTMLKPRPDDLDPGMGEIGDIGVLYYDRDSAELEDWLHEEIIVSLSPFWSAPRDEAGNCELCGKKCTDRVASFGEEPASFATLLKGMRPPKGKA